MSSRAFTAFYRENRGLVKNVEGDPIAEGMGGRHRKKPGSSRPVTDHDTAGITYRCFLPDLTRFVTVCCVGTSRMIQALGLGGLVAHAPDGHVRLYWIPADFQNRI
jgi:hypothetical protein